jgi:hypothetical protein
VVVGMVNILTKKVLKVVVRERGGTAQYGEMVGCPPPDYRVLKT